MSPGSCTVAVGAVNSGPDNQAVSALPSVSQPATLSASKLAARNAQPRDTHIATRLPGPEATLLERTVELRRPKSRLASWRRYRGEVQSQRAHSCAPHY